MEILGAKSNETISRITTDCPVPFVPHKNKIYLQVHQLLLPGSKRNVLILVLNILDLSLEAKIYYFQIDRHSKSIDVDKKCCGRCRGRFELIVNGKLTKSGSGNSRTTPRTPNGGTPNKFALFVKENYKQCR